MYTSKYGKNNVDNQLLRTKHRYKYENNIIFSLEK